MPAHVRVRVTQGEAGAAAAAKGAVLCVCGGTPELGSWDPKRSPKLKLAAGGIWEAQLDGTTAPPGSEYKYVVLNESLNVYIWEQHCPLRVIPPAGAQAPVHDFDKAAPAPQSAAPVPSKAPSKAQHAPAAKAGEGVRLALRTKGQVMVGTGCVVVCGEGAALGNWNPENAVRMKKVEGADPKTGTNWEVDVPVAPGTPFKYVVVGGPAGTKWEDSRANRTVGEGGPDSLPHCFDRTEPFEGGGNSQPAAAPQPATNGTPAPAPVHAPPVVLAAEAGVAKLSMPESAPVTSDGSAGAKGDGPPAWYVEGVVYQIQTLGFCGAETLPNDGQSAPVKRLEKLLKEDWVPGHLKRLGATVLYLGPLFESSELGHGYDTADYLAVDRRLGDVDLLRQVVEAAHSAGIRVILDGVFNHTGRRFFACRDVESHGKASKYWGWYHCKERPGGGVDFKCWEGHSGLPILNHANLEVQEYIFHVAKYWLTEIGLDGWRLDVAHEVHPDFWRAFASHCRAAKPDCLLLGELMHGDYNHHCGPGLLHSGTNYQLSKAYWSSLNDANYFELAHCHKRCAESYGSLTLLNFLGCHDTPRIASRLRDPRLCALAAASILLGDGVPCIYYGDELAAQGTTGGPNGDAAVRQCIDLRATEAEPAAAACLELTSQLAALRRASPALRAGTSLQVPLANTNTALAFGRRGGGQTALVVFNCASEPATLDLHNLGTAVGLADKTQLRDGFGIAGGALAKPSATPLTVAGGALSVGVPAFGVRVLLHGS